MAETAKFRATYFDTPVAQAFDPLDGQGFRGTPKPLAAPPAAPVVAPVQPTAASRLAGANMRLAAREAAPVASRIAGDVATPLAAKTGFRAALSAIGKGVATVAGSKLAGVAGDLLFPAEAGAGSMLTPTDLSRRTVQRPIGGWPGEEAVSGPDFIPAPTAGNVEDPRAENYGRGITEVFNAPGQQGRSFTNLIPAGAPVTGINEMTQRFREQPQGAVSDSGAVLTNTSGRGSLRTESTPGATTAPAAEATGFRPAKAGQRVYAPTYNAVYGSVAQQRQEYDTARLGMRNADITEQNNLLDAQTAAAKNVVETTKLKLDVKKAEKDLGVNLKPYYKDVTDPATLMVTKTFAGFASEGGPNPVQIPIEALTEYRALQAAAQSPEELQNIDRMFKLTFMGE